MSGKKKFSAYALTASIWLFCTPSYADNAFDGRLPTLKELSETQVTSVSKKPEAQFKTASSVSIITQEDIRRSGATSIAEALRYVPGLNVAQIDASKWAVSARGFNRQYSNKLLVLVDGRTVYTPLFSGVFWDSEDTILADIDRIEVIRGPGATLWGSNAVNGVINIITKKSQNTQGTYLSALYGNQENGTFEARYGGEIDANTSYRVYTKALAKEELTNLTDQTGNDDGWKQYRGGFRIDSAPSIASQWTLSGEAYAGDIDQVQEFPGLVTPAVKTALHGHEKTHGFHLLGNWEQQTSKSNQKISSYIDYYDRDIDNLLRLQVLTFDANYQRLHKLNSKNELMWGAGYRHVQDSLDSIALSNNQAYLDYFPNGVSGSIYSGFIQNEYKAIPNVLHFTLGSKIEHHYFTGLEIQPNARFAWYPSDNHTIWGAISKASRTPTRAEQTISFVAASTAGGFVRANGNPDFTSEDLIAYELGHRFKATQKLSLDTSVFYNTYDNLRTIEPSTSGFPSTGTVANLVLENQGFGEAYGFDLEAHYTPLSNWALTANYSYIELDFHADTNSGDTSLAAEEVKTPEQQLSILSRVNLPHNVEFDTNILFTDKLEAFDISNHTRVDARIGWKPTESISLSLVGQNLFDSSHPEFEQFLYWTSAEVDRSVYAKIEVNF